MDLHPIESSMIQALGYDPATRTLAVQFTAHTIVAGGDLWHYADVPEAAYELLRGADSVGQAFGRHIRGRYKGVKQPRAEEEVDG